MTNGRSYLIRDMYSRDTQGNQERVGKHFTEQRDYTPTVAEV